MPYIQINIVNQGTPHINKDGEESPSAFGHTWYEIHQAPNDVGKSYGFGPTKDGMPFATKGEPIFDDNANYVFQNGDYKSPLIPITQEQ